MQMEPFEVALPADVLNVLREGPPGNKPAKIVALVPPPPLAEVMPDHEEEDEMPKGYTNNRTSPNGLEIDKLSLMYEPLSVKVTRKRVGGAPESIRVANQGQGWSKENIKTIEDYVSETSGGGDYEVVVTDAQNQKLNINFNLAGTPKETPMASTYPGQQTQQQGTTQIAPGVSMAQGPNGMPIIITTGNNGQSQEPQNGGMSPISTRAASQMFGPHSAELGSEVLALRERLNQAEREKVELRFEAQKRVEIDALNQKIERITEALSTTRNSGPSDEVRAMQAQMAEMKAQLAQERAEERHRAEAAETARRFEETQRRFEEQRREDQRRYEEMQRQMVEAAKPKEDPAIRMMMEIMKQQTESQREAIRMQTDAQTRQLESQREQARENREMMREMKGNEANLLPTMMSSFEGVNRLQSGVMQFMMGALKEINGMNQGGGDPAWLRVIEPVVSSLPEIANKTLTALAMASEAKRAQALAGANSAAIEVTDPQRRQLPEGRKPRGADAAPAPAPVTEKPATLDGAPATPEARSQAPSDPLTTALSGYNSAVPGENDKHDHNMWSGCLPKVKALRAAVVSGKAKPTDAAQALLHVYVQEAQFETLDSVPALRMVSADEIQAAEFVGLALGPTPEGVEDDAYLTFKRETLAAFRQGLTKVIEQLKAAAAQDGGEEEEEEEDDEGTDEAPATA